MKKMLKFLTHRVMIIVFLMIIQMYALIGMIVRFNNYFALFYTLSTVAGALIILHIINSGSNPAYKLAWIIPVMLVPIFGGLLYLLFGRVPLLPRKRRQLAAVEQKSRQALREERPGQPAFGSNAHAANQSQYIQKFTHIPPYGNTHTHYLASGEEKLEQMKEALEQAQHYIFLEYFIVEEGVMWGQILEVLRRKASAGVDVRVIYDDMGCMFTLPYRYDKKLEAAGIKACVFNPFVPVLSSLFNNRDHRKIAVIDGVVGFTGGVNLADEYINVKEKHGHWKDSAVMLRGEAVWGLAVMFLSTWDSIRGEAKPYGDYRPDYSLLDLPPNGVVQPYWDTPLDGEPVCENVFMNLIYKAERYVYITTPYLILDNEMVTALCTAAKCGVDVRILTPHQGDRWFVHTVTRAYYENLVENGVRIFEYTPGFIHAKSFVVDGRYGVVGTANLDYRSLYLHYECCVWMYDTSAVLDLRDDILRTQKLCRPILLEDCKRVPWPKKVLRSVLRIFAPLM